ncbi:hypothetical protein KFZ70_02550 [Tamlana fucoidanivorans]|uniref:Uncharacterized protein n=1 Tax=Allotamlana fucoidanivorans TaxID=2583814 RepID=A0A5C4SBV9_9FLAO|nr:hypothetical protein [Tamlana fucoidanivorans]TNJ41087.1 hypothetical protein FGF67_16550 [Tamlana fucoidanivorans]
MKPNQYLFEKFKNLLNEEFSQEINKYEDGNHLTIADTGFWISVDDKELIIGFGLNHTHYNFDYDSMEDAIDTFFLLLTKKKKITDYSKGSRIFKTKVEIEVDNEELINLGTTATFPLKFWKKTELKTSYSNELLKTEKVTEQWKELINYAQHYV